MRGSKTVTNDNLIQASLGICFIKGNLNIYSVVKYRHDRQKKRINDLLHVCVADSLHIIRKRMLLLLCGRDEGDGFIL